jgi:hypothetical protein
MNTQIINQAITRVPEHGIISSFLIGAGLSYSVQIQKYWHIPFVFLCPTVYAGYHIFKNKQDVILFTNRNIRT